MKRKWIHTILALVLVAGSLPVYFSRTTDVFALETDAVTLPSAPIPEAKDFATVNFRDAWDMSDFSDVSQNFNNGGRTISFSNPLAQNGIFSAVTTRDIAIGPSLFQPLFPGYDGAIHNNKNIGRVHPIPSSQYACLYIAMKVDSPDYIPGSGVLPDFFVAGWDANYSGTPSGNTLVYLYPESMSGSPVVHNWKLYKVDLSNPANGLISGSTAWLSLAQWQGLRIHPSTFRNITISVEWIRLTSCASSTQYNAQISWTPDGSVNSIWVRPEGTTRDIQVATGINGSLGSYTLDTRGLPPGRYQVGLGTQTTCCSQRSTGFLTINQMPVASFLNPSFTSGTDYATMAGNPWDIEADDVTDIECTTPTFTNHMLLLDTLYPAALPASCKGGIGEADSKIYLNLPGGQFNAGDYRYLNLSHRIDGAWALPADGMIGRLIWQTTDNCVYVSRHFVYDVGLRQYSIDLFDSFNGTPIQYFPTTCRLKTWSQAGLIKALRFDPDENYTGIYVPAMVFHQEIHWIRLTQENRAAIGSPFRAKLWLNKAASSLTSANFYYTSDLNNPTQHVARTYAIASPPPLPPGFDHKVYLPLLANDYSLSDLVFNWDTSGVAPGNYYLCASLNDNYNQATYCSEVYIQLYTP